MTSRKICYDSSNLCVNQTETHTKTMSRCTYCKTVRRICLRNHFYDCISNSNQCISDHWHNEIDLIDIWHPDNHPHHVHYGNPSNHHIFSPSAHKDQLFFPLWMEILRLVLRNVCRRVDICDRLDGWKKCYITLRKWKMILR